ncbi:MAG: CAP domain-containing protein [Acidimicrobiia bacterium]
MHRLLTLVAVVMAAVVPLATPAMADRSNPAADEQAFVAKINQLRAEKGLRPLAVDGELTTIGRRWAGKMAAAGQISHNKNFPNEVTQDWEKLGENVGVGSNVDELHDAFVKSPAHFRNLVDKDFTHIGVGVVYTEDGSLYTSHQFMKLRASAPPPPPRVSTPTTRPRVTTGPAATNPPATTPVTRPDNTPTTPGTAATPPPSRPSPRFALMLEELRRLGAYRG